MHAYKSNRFKFVCVKFMDLFLDDLKRYISDDELVFVEIKIEFIESYFIEVGGKFNSVRVGYLTSARFELAELIH